MDDREAIFAALPPVGHKARMNLPKPPLPIHSVEVLWDVFGHQLELLGGRIATRAEVEVFLSRPHTIDSEAALILGLPSGGAPIWDAEVGITTADLAIAETASLLLATGPSRPRMTSLSPVIHVVLVPREKIVATLAEGFTRLSDRTTVMITGPSRTADIEGVLVRGVHGPGDIVVVPV